MKNEKSAMDILMNHSKERDNQINNEENKQTIQQKNNIESIQENKQYINNSINVDNNEESKQPSLFANNIETLQTINQANNETIVLKTFRIGSDMSKMFKYIKFKEGLGENVVLIEAIEKYFIANYGDNWRDLLK